MNIATLPVRPEVYKIAKYNAGLSSADVEKRCNGAKVVKLGSNENPLGASPLVAQALQTQVATLNLYPDPQGRLLKHALAEKYKVPTDRIILGNGSEELLSIIYRATLNSGEHIVTPYPSFPLHEDYATLQGADVSRVPLDVHLELDVAALKTALLSKPKLFVIANPVNPVGSWLNNQQLTDLLESVAPETLLILDEAYAEYAFGADYADSLALLKNSSLQWIVLRTFSKAYGLAGLRVGYGIASNAQLIDMFDRVRSPFNVNTMAQTAALAALSDDGHLAKTIAHNSAEREQVRCFLEDNGFTVAPSRTNFLFFKVHKLAADLSEEFLDRGVILKPWKQHGYDNYLRVSIGSSEDNQRFMQAVTEIFLQSLLTKNP